MLLIPAIGGLDVLTNIICNNKTSSTKYISDFTYEHLHKTDPMLPNARGVHNRKGSALTPYPSPNLVTHSAFTSPNQQMKLIAVEKVNAQMCKNN